ncbi:MAG TPA: class I SAM-dependent methyltransferase [Actinomycetota bacterium]|nr:class I SAM-dependent methyltransferase [Actinomycetota bacterium]
MERWGEDDSEVYRRLAPIAVPAREEMLATLCCLLPFHQRTEFLAVELGCGEGTLASTLLDCFPRARLMALDGSASMRDLASRRLERFGDRARVEPFELADPQWLPLADGAGGVLSSLVLHHLDGGQKKALFDELARRLGKVGALLIADLVEPQRIEGRALLAAGWDDAARSAALQLGDPDAFEAFEQAHWNYYRYPDPADKPSPLATQLRWLQAAGFLDVDCFWLRAGHAVYGGYLGSPPADGTPLPFHRALGAARSALDQSPL